jgi:hypothetical protein
MLPIRKKSATVTASPRRIETQIHRRKKAKAVYPMQAEWEEGTALPPERLRMPPEKMSHKKGGRSGQ